MRILHAGRLIAGVLIAGFAPGLGTGHATVVYNCPSGVSCSLQDLFNGGNIVIADNVFHNDIKTFGNWSLKFTFGGVPDFSLINVVGLDDQSRNPGLNFIANGQLRTTSLLDLAFDFTVGAASASFGIADNSLALTNFDFGGGTGDIGIDEFTFDAVGNTLGDTRVEANLLFDTFNLFDIAQFPPQSSIIVEKSITIESDAGNAVSLDGFTQRYSEIPEPATLALFGIGLVTFSLVRLLSLKD